ncbi:hypothetical protein E7Y32_07955 [Arthrobacter sp. UKPF54-2]|uniref:hypothetical protein n=1 Tax=Arthrobacter sp. UKPF54-2 TaxID=2600159 RepID=UPI0011B1C481|nr:hypothetical protein [Arthrobacter sp. UKPF54-2]QDY90149.1 hypothetical protein E7Y32_07955 [Arthrobacter sp. UKPF54-2]
MRRRAAAPAALAVVLLLVGCAGPPDAADRSYRGMLSTSAAAPGAPSAAPPQTLGQPVVAWVDRPRRFGITLWGSSSCPAIPSRIEAAAPDRVSIRIEPSAGNPCTADLAPTSHEFGIPPGAGTLPLTITLVYAQGERTRTLVLE